MMGAMDLCRTCKHCIQESAARRRCNVAAPLAQLMESGAPVGLCKLYVRESDGARLIVDDPRPLTSEKR